MASIAVATARLRGAPAQAGGRSFSSCGDGLQRSRSVAQARRHGVRAPAALPDDGRELDLRPDDDLLDVGCGSAGMLGEQASHVRHVAGLDASETQVGMADGASPSASPPGRQRSSRAMPRRSPWEDGRFSVVTAR